MVFIDIKQQLLWTWQQCVHIYHHIIHYNTGNVCCVLVPITHVFISQSKNHISIIKSHVLRYVFMFITSLHDIQCTEDSHWTKRRSSPPEGGVSEFLQNVSVLPNGGIDGSFGTSPGLDLIFLMVCLFPFNI